MTLWGLFRFIVHEKGTPMWKVVYRLKTSENTLKNRLDNIEKQKLEWFVGLMEDLHFTTGQKNHMWDLMRKEVEQNVKERKSKKSETS